MYDKSIYFSRCLAESTGTTNVLISWTAVPVLSVYSYCVLVLRRRCAQVSLKAHESSQAMVKKKAMVMRERKVTLVVGSDS